MKIGQIDIPQAVLLAPMEDVSDIPFRRICKRLGADIMYTEFVNAEGLIRSSKKTHRKMTFLPEERPMGIQIYGGEERSMGEAARIAEQLGPDIIDINCGCWVKNVVGHGAGAGLLRDLPRMQRLVATVVKAVGVPVTVKTRLGWDAASIRIVEVAKMMEDAGAQALTVHCRVRGQGHKGDPDYTYIPAVKAAVTMPIVVNGGINSAAKAKEVFDTTGCDGIMVAQASVNNPWIFNEIKRYLTTGTMAPPPSFEERISVLLDHLRFSVEEKGEKYGVMEFRKHYSGYLREQPGISQLRSELMRYTELEPIIERISEYAAAVTAGMPFIPKEQIAA
jgi:tRNA-dihydrouridine synthase B